MSDDLLMRLRSMAQALPDVPLDQLPPSHSNCRAKGICSSEPSKLVYAFFHDGPNLFLICDPGTTTWYVNRRWTDELGWTAAECDDKQFKLFHQGDVKPLLKAIQGLQSVSGGVVTARVRSKAGGFRKVRWQARKAGGLYHLTGEILGGNLDV